VSAYLRFGIAFILSLAAGWSQVASGTITGAVEDASSAPIPDAEVTLKHTVTGETRVTRTNQLGEFRAPFPHLGEYSVTVSAQGFATKVLSGIDLRVDQTGNLELKRSQQHRFFVQRRLLITEG
jgi:hypothetical protein